MKGKLLSSLALMIGGMFMPASSAKVYEGEKYPGGMPKNPKKIIPKGCQEWDVCGEKILALTYERAYDKYWKRFKK